MKTQMTKWFPEDGNDLFVLLGLAFLVGAILAVIGVYALVKWLA